MNPDFYDLLVELLASDASFLVVGAHALAAHGAPRSTNDIDVWVKPTFENAERVWRALLAFGAPVQALGVTIEDLHTPDMVVQIGQPPRRIDVMTGVSGLPSFEQAWERRLVGRVGAIDVPFLGREDFLVNKRASGRHKDLGDVDALGGE